MKIYEGIPLEQLLGDNGAKLTIRPIGSAEAKRMAREHGAEFPSPPGRGVERAMETLKILPDPLTGVDPEERFMVYKIISWNHLRWWIVSYDSDADGELPMGEFDDDDRVFEGAE